MSRYFYMRRFTLVAPTLTKDGQASFAQTKVRNALRANAIDVWTEYSTTGAWKGETEPGTVFEIYRELYTEAAAVEFARLLGHIGREAMPDQEAIQVTVDPGSAMVLEF